MSQTLRLELLGPPCLKLAGNPLSDLTINKAHGLLYYLAVTGRAHPRESISTLLWPETSTSQARKNLRNLLPHLRDAVGSHLDITRSSLAFDRQSPHWLDVHILTSTLAEHKALGNTEPNLNALSHAAELYRGDFLDGFQIQNAPEFEAWIATEREHLRELAIDGMTLLVKHYDRQNQAEKGVATAKELLALDPWRETTHQQLMLLLARSGNRSAALNQYLLCQQMLADEFGVEPMEETTELYEQIKAGVYDKETRRGGDREARRQSHPLSLSPPLPPLLLQSQKCLTTSSPR